MKKLLLAGAMLLAATAAHAQAYGGGIASGLSEYERSHPPGSHDEQWQAGRYTNRHLRHHWHHGSHHWRHRHA
jgi:hypothetical protein